MDSKGKIACDPNKKALPPPDDIVLQHKELVIYQNPTTRYCEQLAFQAALHHIRVKGDMLQNEHYKLSTSKLSLVCSALNLNSPTNNNALLCDHL